jgi:hypothetical protein
MMGLGAPLAIVANDAGAANIILSWLSVEDLAEVRAVMAGPALALWKSRFGDAPCVSSMDEALDGAAALLSGTGWASDVEHRARKAARDLDLLSVAVIDHWVNYPDRFVRDGETVLPDRIWVTDAYALAEARRTLPGTPSEERPNLYLSGQAEAAGPLPPAGDVLFAAEPARSNWGRDSAGEFQTLDYFMAHRAAIGLGAAPVRVRPHPSDPAGKYDAWIAAHPGAAVDRSPDMATALRPASTVVGMNSFAMVIALAAGRQTICALPPWSPPWRLPHEGVLHLSRLGSD